MGTTSTSTSEPPINPGTIGGNPSDTDVLDMRMLAVLSVARYHGIELDRRDLRLEPGERVPSPAALVAWLREQGLVSKASRISWAQLLRLTPGVGQNAPIVLLFTDGSAGILVGSDASRNIVWVRDPRSSGDDAVAVDRLRLSQLWDGETILVRRPRGTVDADRPFSLSFIFRLVTAQHTLMRDICIASLILSVLTILPPLLVMTVIDKVINHQSFSTLTSDRADLRDHDHVRDALGLCPA